MTFRGLPTIITGSAVGVGVKVGDGLLVGCVVAVAVGSGEGEFIAVVGAIRLILGVGVADTANGGSVRHAASRNNEVRMIASRIITTEFIDFLRKAQVLLIFNSPGNPVINSNNFHIKIRLYQAAKFVSVVKNTLKKCREANIH